MNIIWFHLCELSRIDKLIKTKSRLGYQRPGKWGNDKFLLNGQFLVQSDASFRKLIVMAIQHCDYNATELDTLKMAKIANFMLYIFITMFKK